MLDIRLERQRQTRGEKRFEVSEVHQRLTSSLITFTEFINMRC
jgi:hypothetical protein